MEKASENALVITGVGTVIGSVRPPADLWRAVVERQTPGEVRVHHRFPGVEPFAHVKADDGELASHVPGIKRPLPSLQSLLALAAVHQAIRSDRVGFDSTPSCRIGIVTSSEFGPSSVIDAVTTAAVADGPRALSPLRFARSVQNAVLGDIARRYGITGPTLALGGECPLPAALSMMATGAIDAVVCVGVDEIGGALPAWSCDGLLASTPEDDGLVPADAAGAIVLRREREVAGRGGRWTRVEEVRTQRGPTPRTDCIPQSSAPCHDESKIVLGAGRRATRLQPSRDVRCAGRSHARPWSALGEPFAAESVIGIALASHLLESRVPAPDMGSRPGSVVVTSADLAGNHSTTTLALTQEDQ